MLLAGAAQATPTWWDSADFSNTTSTIVLMPGESIILDLENDWVEDQQKDIYLYITFQGGSRTNDLLEGLFNYDNGDPINHDPDGGLDGDWEGADEEFGYDVPDNAIGMGYSYANQPAWDYFKITQNAGAPGSVTFTVEARSYCIPEPSTLALIGLASGGVLFIRRLRLY